MFRKKLIALSAMLIAGLLVFQANVSADAIEEKPYLSLGADLTATQKRKVLELLDVKEDEFDQYKVVIVTNKDEHAIIKYWYPLYLTFRFFREPCSDIPIEKAIN